ncbi:unnamed protein product [Medioppia subpectinata]|uniref:C2H2-type domain-containing protein n=1 Tax=Medioppia subpectinata TaxID=1979941 RepID=A0A7R9KC46_9ACAR|nr:unnamed protein product [Medioppia subpectinata]CAG2100657.1 unnamed protein product [Medioppia subpectinata]
MASIHTSVLVSIKTLCPEVGDYWLSIPSHVKTIDGLKQHILSDNCIVKDMDDVELYLSDGLLRGHSSIAGVIRDRDRIEMRIKYMDKKRINSSADSTSGHKRSKSSVNECIILEDSDDETMSGRLVVETIVKTEKTSANPLNCDRKPSIDIFISSPPKVFIKSEFKHKTDTKRAHKSVINECKDKVIVKSEPIDSGDCPPDSTASILSAAVVTQSGRKINADNTVSHKSTKSAATESASVVDSDDEPLSNRFNFKTISTKKVIVKSESSGESVERKPNCTASISSASVVTQSGGKYHTTNTAIKTLGSVSEPRNSSIGDVIRDRDRIEVRPKFADKRRIRSLPDSTIGHTKPVKSKSNGSVDYRPNSRASISSATAVVTQSGGKCQTTNVAIKTLGPVVEPQRPSGSGQIGQWWRLCREPDCHFKTESLFELHQHKLIHRTRCELCTVRIGRTFKNKRKLDEHHRTSHPNDYPIIQAIKDTKRTDKLMNNGSEDRVAQKVIVKSGFSGSNVFLPISTATGEVRQSGGKCHTSVAMKTTGPVVEPQRLSRSGQSDKWWRVCREPKCGYKTESYTDLRQHHLIHRITCDVCVGRTFRNRHTFDEHYRTSHPNYYSFVRDINDTKKAKKSVINESGDRVAANAVLESQSRGPIGCRPDSTASISSATAVVTQSSDKWRTKSVAMKTNKPMSVSAPTPGTGSTGESRTNVATKPCILRKWLACGVFGCRSLFVDKDTQYRHHLCSHPYEFPDTLRPKVPDYWLPIPAAVKTIDGLKRHILTNECIDKDMDDVDVYYDRIELRPNWFASKQRISSLPDTTIGHKKSVKSKSNGSVDYRPDCTTSISSATAVVTQSEHNSHHKTSLALQKNGIESIVCIGFHKDIVPRNNFIVKDMDDIQLYLYNGLLRGNASIGDVLQNRDCIEVRVKSATKRRISSSVDNVSDRLKRIRISTNECTTLVDSNDETVVETESISGNQLKALTEEIVNVVKDLIIDKIVGQSQDNSDGKASIDSSTSTDTIADIKTPATAVVTQSDDIWAEFVGTSVAKPMMFECCSRGCDYKTDNRHHFLLHSRAIHRRFMCQFCHLVSFKSKSKLEGHYFRVHSSHCLDTPWIKCTHEGCGYQTKHNKNMRKHIDKMHGLRSVDQISIGYQYISMSSDNHLCPINNMTEIKSMVILVSMKTLRPEVKDFWVTIGRKVTTFAELKRHILGLEAVGDRPFKDIGLYLDNGLLRDDSTSIGDVLRGKERLEVRDINDKSEDNLPAKLEVKSETMDWKASIAPVEVVTRLCCPDPLCSYKTDDLFAFNRHNLLHRIPCHVCGRTYQTVSTLGQHYRKVHPGTLRPEVDDYWLPIPAAVKTIDGLKRQILTNECIDKDMDDVQLYLSGGLLRGHSSIGDVLRDRDRIELRVKCLNKKRINSSVDSTSGHKRCKCLVNECVTVMASDDGSLSGGSAVQTIVKTEGISGNQLNDFTGDTDIMARIYKWEQMKRQLQDNRDGESSIDSSTSVATISGPKSSSAPKVFIKSEFKHKTDTKSVTQSGDNCNTRSVATNTVTPEVGPQWPSGSGQTAAKWWRKCPQPGCDYKTDNWFELRQHILVHRITCYLCFGRTFRTQDELDSHYRRLHPNQYPNRPLIIDNRKAEKSVTNEFNDRVAENVVLLESESNGIIEFGRNSTANISLATAVDTQSGDECHTRSVATNAKTCEAGPKWTAELVGRKRKRVPNFSCGRRGCDYKTESRQDFEQHMPIHWRRVMSCCGQHFRRNKQLIAHQFKSHPNGTDSMASISSAVTAVATQVVKPDVCQPCDGQMGAELMIFECCSPGCDYKTDNPEHYLLHRGVIHHQFMCQLCNLQPLRTAFKLEKHHRRVHPNDFPDIPWIACTHEGCVYQTKDDFLLRKHINKKHHLMNEW